MAEGNKNHANGMSLSMFERTDAGVGCVKDSVEEGGRGRGSFALSMVPTTAALEGKNAGSSTDLLRNPEGGT